MTHQVSAKALSQILEISSRTLFRYKRELGEKAPPFDDVAAWQRIKAERLVNDPMNYRPMGERAAKAKLTILEEKAKREAIEWEAAALTLAERKKKVVTIQYVNWLVQHIALTIQGKLKRLRHDFPCEMAGRSEVEIDTIVTAKFNWLLDVLHDRSSWDPDGNGYPIEPASAWEPDGKTVVPEPSAAS